MENNTSNIDLIALNAEMDAIVDGDPSEGSTIKASAHSTGCTLLGASGRGRNVNSTITNFAYRYTPGNSRRNKFVIVANGNIYRGTLSSGNGGEEAHDLVGTVTSINGASTSNLIDIHADDIRQISMNQNYILISTSGIYSGDYFGPEKGQIRNIITDCEEEEED